jgi:hypothetical protein
MNTVRSSLQIRKRGLLLRLSVGLLLLRSRSVSNPKWHWTASLFVVSIVLLGVPGLTPLLRGWLLVPLVRLPLMRLQWLY